jgi:hypothetical protein
MFVDLAITTKGTKMKLMLRSVAAVSLLLVALPQAFAADKPVELGKVTDVKRGQAEAVMGIPQVVTVRVERGLVTVRTSNSVPIGAEAAIFDEGGSRRLCIKTQGAYPPEGHRASCSEVVDYTPDTPQE